MACIYFKNERSCSTKIVLNLNLREKHPRGRPRSRGEKQIGKTSCRRKGEHGRNMRRRSFGKAEIDREAWLLDNPYKNRNVKGRQ
jgi:hypothetical protein